MINTIEGGGHVEEAEQRDMSVVSRRQSVRRHAQNGRQEMQLRPERDKPTLVDLAKLHFGGATSQSDRKTSTSCV